MCLLLSNSSQRTSLIRVSGGSLENLQGPLWALSSLDGRYHKKLDHLKTYLSEGALMSSRIEVELKWMLHLVSQMRSSKLRLPWEVTEHDVKTLSNLVESDLKAYASDVKDIEKQTNHDVKAVEYFLRNKLKNEGVSENTLAMIHFACTSEDINNLSYSLLHKKVNDEIIVPGTSQIIQQLSQKALKFQNSAMMSRTHGQHASPTTMGKELLVFAHRFDKIVDALNRTCFYGKMNGAVGNYNAHMTIDPQADWESIAQSFVEDTLALTWNPLTTQIENHDGLSLWCQTLQNFATVSIDLAQDIWGYISLGYFKQTFLEHEVGSSTMPHKINPIDFENAEGNFGVAINLGEFFARKLPVSRWQRDLSDSTVLRVISQMIGHHVLAQTSLLKGLSKITIDEETLSLDLKNSPELLSEPLQTIMRAYGIKDAYERLKKLTRGQTFTLDHLHSLLNDCHEIPEFEKEKFLKLTPETYLGLAPDLTKKYASRLLEKYSMA